MFDITQSAHHLRDTFLTIGNLEDQHDDDLAEVLANHYLTQYETVRSEIRDLLAEGSDWMYDEIADNIVQAFQSPADETSVLHHIGLHVKAICLEGMKDRIGGEDHQLDARGLAVAIENESLMLSAQAGEYA